MFTNISIPFDKLSNTLSDYEWKRLDQPEDIKECLNKRNTVHLHQTQGTTCTIDLIIKLLEIGKFTKFGDVLLKGSANFEDIGLSTLQKGCFNEIKI